MYIYIYIYIYTYIYVYTHTHIPGPLHHRVPAGPRLREPGVRLDGQRGSGQEEEGNKHISMK